MSTLTKLRQVANDAAKVYEGRERYIRAIKAIKHIEKIYRLADEDNEYEEEPDYSRGHRDAAKVIADVCQKNGGIWVKFAQYLSCRPDLLPIEYIEELQKLQYSAEPTPFAAVVQRMQTQWGDGWEEYFDRFDLIPIATASIAQVYKARLKSGEAVAVKILIPGIEEAFEQDAVVFRSLAKLINPIIKEIEIVRITEHLIEMTASELSFSRELTNLRLFEDLPLGDFIELPRVFPQYSNEKIIVTAWVEGVLLTHVLKTVSEENKDIVEKLMVSLTQQIFKFGIFHADPHPGNIIVKEKTLVLLDFGLVARLTESQKQNFLAILLVLLSGRGLDQLPDLFEKAGFEGLTPEAFDKIVQYMEHRNQSDELDKLLNGLIQELRKHSVSIPESFISLARVIIIFCGLTDPYNISLSDVLMRAIKSN